jgi:hypothetical protein
MQWGPEIRGAGHRELGALGAHHNHPIQFFPLDLDVFIG